MRLYRKGTSLMVCLFACSSVGIQTSFEGVFKFGGTSRPYGWAQEYRVPESDLCNAFKRERVMTMFPQMQQVAKATVDIPNVPSGPYTTSDRARQSVFGLPQSPASHRDQQSVQVMQGFIRSVAQGMLEEAEERGEEPVLIYCNAHFVKWMQGTDLVPQGLRQRRGQTINDLFGDLLRTHWIFFVPQAGRLNPAPENSVPRNTGAFMAVLKTETPAGADGGPFAAGTRPPRGPGSRARNICDQRGTDAWSIVPSRSAPDAPHTAIVRPILILCPAFFDREPKALDFATQPSDTSLASIEPDWFPFYHELFHLFVPNALKDYNYYIYNEGRRLDRFVDGAADPEKERENWDDTGRPAHGPTQILALALYDQTYAGGDPNNVFPFEQLKAIRNPESFAWYSLMITLWTFNKDHQDWSTGRIQGDSFVQQHVEAGGEAPPTPPPAFPNPEPEPGPRDKRPARDPPEGVPAPSRPRYGPDPGFGRVGQPGGYGAGPAEGEQGPSRPRHGGGFPYLERRFLSEEANGTIVSDMFAVREL